MYISKSRLVNPKGENRREFGMDRGNMSQIFSSQKAYKKIKEFTINTSVEKCGIALKYGYVGALPVDWNSLVPTNAQPVVYRSLAFVSDYQDQRTDCAGQEEGIQREACAA